MSSRSTGRRPGRVVAACGVATALLMGTCTTSGPIGTTSTAPAVSPSSGPSSSPTAGGVVADVVLVPDPECRNGGTIMVEGVGWQVLTTQSAAWRDRNEVPGTLTLGERDRGLFTDDEGRAVAVTTGEVEAVCFLWPGD